MVDVSGVAAAAEVLYWVGLAPGLARHGWCCRSSLRCCQRLDTEEELENLQVEF